MISFLKKIFFSQKPEEVPLLFTDIYKHVQMYPVAVEENYIRALTHSSATKKIAEKNERLEFLGDAVINFCVAEILYFRMEGKDEGTLTKARASIVNRKNLNKVGVEIGIPQYLKHKLSEKQLEEAPDIIGNAFEALIGAYYLDYDMDNMKVLIDRLIMKDFDALNFQKNVSDYKSYLFEWVQSKKKRISFVHHTAPADPGVFMVSLQIDEEFCSSGSGRNKKEAEQQACMNAIKTLALEA